MAIIKCKMCGGDLVLTEGNVVAECEYCGTRQTVPTADNDKKLTLFTRANRLRAGCEFDKAAGVYETIVADFPEEAEAYWGLVLCKYGIEYVDDPATGKKIPTCHRSSFDSVMDDTNFDMAMEYSEPEALQVYRQEAKAIEQIRRGIMEVSSKEEPYDIFVCYKETDEKGERTVDSVIAQDIYDELTRRDYRVFFARITLEDKLGVAYEPYIFAALNSAKIMLAVGSRYEYYNAVWVKNEWSRFLKLMAADKSKHLIPCFKNLDAYDIPREFSHLQAQDMGKVGALQDLMRGIEKLLPKKEAAPEVAPVVQTVAASNTAPLLKRVFIFLEDGDWKAADEYAEKVLDIDPENPQAYVGKLMANLRVHSKEALLSYPHCFSSSPHYQKILRYSNDEFARKLKENADHRDVEAKDRERQSIYDKAAYIAAQDVIEEQEDTPKGKSTDGRSGITVADLDIAIKLFRSIAGFRDADQQAEACLLKRQQAIYDKAMNMSEKIAGDTQAVLIERMYGIKNKKRGNSIEDLEAAAELFRSISGFQDADHQAEICETKIQQYRLEATYREASGKANSTFISGVEEAIKIFTSIIDFQDSREQIEKCKERIEQIRLNEQKQLEEMRRMRRRVDGLCQYCGGSFKGLFNKVCADCGKPKDY